MDGVSLTSLLTIVNLLILIGAPVAVIIAFRSKMAEVKQDVETRVRQALTEENTILTSRTTRLETEVRRLNRIIVTIQSAFARQGVRIEIEGETVTLTDTRRARSSTVQIQIDSGELGAIKDKESKP